jgi:hypothetical protein
MFRFGDVSSQGTGEQWAGPASVPKRINQKVRQRRSLLKVQLIQLIERITVAPWRALSEAALPEG